MKDCYIPRDHATGQSRGFGFVRFDSEDDAQAAIEGCDKMDVNGRELRVQVAQVGAAASPMNERGGLLTSALPARSTRGQRSPRAGMVATTAMMTAAAMTATTTAGATTATTTAGATIATTTAAATTATTTAAATTATTTAAATTAATTAAATTAATTAAATTATTTTGIIVGGGATIRSA